MKRSLVLLMILSLFSGCSGKLISRGISSDEDNKATGIRFFDSGVYEVQVFRREIRPDGKTVFNPIGDRQIVTMADTKKLREVNYDANLFASLVFTVELNNDGTLKTVELKNQNTPAASALSSGTAIASSIKDIKRAKQEQQLEDLQRELNLLKLKKELEDLKSGKSQ